MWFPFCQLSRHQLHDCEQHQDEHRRAHDPGRDHMLRLQALRVRLVVGPLAHAEKAPEDRLEGVLHVLPGASKNVYDIEIVARLRGAPASTRKTTGISRVSPVAKVWSEKQKHSCLEIQRIASAGAVFMTACAVTGRPRLLVTR